MMLCVWKSYLFFYLGRVPQRSGLRRCSFLVQWDSRWLYTSRPQHLLSGCPPYWDLRWREPGRHNLHTHRYIVHIIIWNTIVWLRTFVWMSSQVWTTTWKVWELNTAVEFEDLHTDRPPACRPQSWSCWRWFPGRGRRREPWLGWRLRSQTGRPWWWWDCWGHDGRSSGCWPCVRPPPAGWRRYLRGGRGREEVRRGRDTDSCLKRWREGKDEKSDRVCLYSCVLPMWLLAILFSRQGSSRPDGAWMLAVSRLRSVSLMSREKSAAEPSLTWERRWLSSETHEKNNTRR